MNIIKKSALLFTTGLIALSTTAQDSGQSYSMSNAWGIGLGAAVPLGYGLNVSKGLSEKLNVKLGFNTFNIELPASADPTVNTDGKVSFGRVYLGADYHIGGSAFSLGGGVMVNNFGAEATYTAAEAITVTDPNTNQTHTAPVTQVGETKLTIEPALKVAPYFTVGIGRALPKNAVGFRLEFGAIYQGTLEADVTGTSSTIDIGGGQTYTFNPATEPEMVQAVNEANDALSKFSLLPYLSLEFTVKIK